MNFAPMSVNVFAFKVNSMDRSATLSYGPVQQVDTFQANKRNQGFGEENGDLDVLNIPIMGVQDSDLIDNGSTKGSAV
ncbi:hypothetical protein JOD45_003217 [Scopulibacillus daqui]|uniref:Spore germination protein GerPA/GerPF n=1 Tax=Scopulibacillus daqui TaxID=1469162 RepID=A0ABS2Q3V9_9BACL|nr:hypothetical protein [Scopulibacillus daqui]MBM7646982.1 hypothetical protein [Scopulibacillus daqui]